MKLYLAQGRYVGTQAEAKRLDKGFAQVDVPTDKEGLIGYLNEHAGTPTGPYPVDDGTDLLALPAAVVPSPEQQRAEWQSGADVALTPPDVDGIVQRIMGSTGYELKRYASAVAQAFNRLAGD